MALEFADSDFSGGSEPLVAWVKGSLGIVASYYGRFPVSELRVRVSSASGGGVRHGTTFGTPGAFIRITVGRDVSESELVNDWVLVHEMTHLALPDVGPEHVWLSEGVAVYVEGVARAQAGNRPAIDVWAELARSMPRGLPQSGDAGLDHTHSWGRIYWGGALFLPAGRRRDPGAAPDNRVGLQTALRAVSRSKRRSLARIGRSSACSHSAMPPSAPVLARRPLCTLKDAPLAERTQRPCGKAWGLSPQAARCGSMTMRRLQKSATRSCARR